MEYKLSKTELPKFLESTSARFKSSPYSVTPASFKLASGKIETLHYHDTPELGICLSGSGQCQIGKRIYNYKSGDIHIIRAFEPHFSKADKDTESEWRYIAFSPNKLIRRTGFTDPDTLLSILNEGLEFSGVFSPEEYPKLTKAIKKITECSDIKDEITDISVCLSIADFLIESKRTSAKITDNTLKETVFLENNYYKSILPALERISFHIDDNSEISEEKLASSCGMSISTFRRRFIKGAGISPKCYITNTRMSYAEYLLTETNLTVLDIAGRCGYNEISGFNRTFLSFFKTSPSKYRKTK